MCSATELFALRGVVADLEYRARHMSNGVRAILARTLAPMKADIARLEAAVSSAPGRRPA